MPGSTPHTLNVDIRAFVSLLIIASIVAMVGRRVRLPYALALVIVGLALGAPHLIPEAHLEPKTLFLLFLPPLLFESALNIRLRELRDAWQPVAVYAFLGTIAAAFIVGGVFHYILHVPLATSLLFGSILASTDPISVVAVFKRLGVSRKLSVVVESESLFNDGASVVLYGVMLSAATGTPVSFGSGALKFLLVVSGGAGIGLASGMLASRITREFDDHLLEIMLTTIAAWGSYLAAEAIHVSGVIAVVTAGLAVGNYGMARGMSPTTRLAVHSFWEYAAFAINSVVFLLVGLEVTMRDLVQHARIVGLAAIVVLGARALAVYGLSPVVRLLGGSLSIRAQHVLVWGGLRGALSMALVLGLPATLPHRELLKVLTFGVVLFSLIVQGLTVGPVLRFLGLGQQHGERLTQEIIARANAIRAALAEVEATRASGGISSIVHEEIKAGLEKRLADVEDSLEELHTRDESARNSQRDAALRLALIAEKSALIDAANRGLIEHERMRELLVPIDEDLTRLSGGDH